MTVYKTFLFQSFSPSVSGGGLKEALVGILGHLEKGESLVLDGLQGMPTNRK